MNTIKTIFATVITVLGAASGVFTFIGAFPEYKDIFLILFGVCIGYALGLVANILDHRASRSEPLIDSEEYARRRRIALTILLVFLPVLLLLVFMVVGSGVGFIDASNRNSVMAWGFVAILLAYIIGAIAILG